MKVLILFLIRLKLGVKKYEKFRFTNQKTLDIYSIDNYGLWKSSPATEGYKTQSRLGINWLLDSDCHVTKVR